MLYAVDEGQRRRAKTPHELFMFNLSVFHLLATPAAIFSGLGAWALLVPLLLSGAVIVFTWLRGRRAAPWFVMAHWKLALRRYRLLLFAYAASAAIILAGLAVAAGSDPNMGGILFTIFTRFGIMPTFILVVVTFVLESGSIYEAGRGEVPDAVVACHPAPPELQPVEPTATGPGQR